MTAVPYATISVSCWPISDESNRIAMTAFAPSSRALSIMRSIAWRRLSSSSAVYWGTSPWRSAVRLAVKDFATPMLRTTRPNVSPRSRSTVMPSSPRAVVTGKVAGEDSDMTIIIGKNLRPRIHGRTTQLDQVRLQGQPGQVGAAPGSGLGPNPVEPGADGADADGELGGDLGVGAAPRDQGDQFPFAGAEVHQARL